MLKIKLGKIVNYAYQKSEDVIRKAMAEFFGKTEIYPEMENFESIQGLFNEWLIFEFKLKSGTNIISDYYFKNPDNLSQEFLDELKQIIETHFFDLLEIQKIKPGEWFKGYAFFTGKIYKVYEKTGTLNYPSKGSIWGRLAKVNKRWYLVGSNPLFLPLTHTPRTKKMFLRKNKGKRTSCREVLRFLLPSSNEGIKKEDPRELTSKQLKNKKKKIKKKYEKLAEKYNLKVSFQQVVDFVYQENYKTNHLDFYKDLAKLAFCNEDIIFKNIQLFGDIWNYFSHKKLKGKSPAEMYKETYGGK